MEQKKAWFCVVLVIFAWNFLQIVGVLKWLIRQKSCLIAVKPRPFDAEKNYDSNGIYNSISPKVAC
jgi:hypothetical protein